MKVHFKGTRGSIPTAPDASEINEKVVSALLAARGKDLRSESQIREFVAKSLPFHHSSSFGGNTPCVRVDNGSRIGLFLTEVQDCVLEMRSCPLVRWADISSFPVSFSLRPHSRHSVFTPAYIPETRSFFMAVMKILKLPREQMRTPYFPIDFNSFQSEISFVKHIPGEIISLCIQPSLFTNKIILWTHLDLA